MLHQPPPSWFSVHRKLPPPQSAASAWGFKRGGFRHHGHEPLTHVECLEHLSLSPPHPGPIFKHLLPKGRPLVGRASQETPWLMSVGPHEVSELLPGPLSPFCHPQEALMQHFPPEAGPKATVALVQKFGGSVLGVWSLQSQLEHLCSHAQKAKTMPSVWGMPASLGRHQHPVSMPL